jgi:hypothetical protein
MCGEKENHEEREKKELKYAMQSIISWRMAMTIVVSVITSVLENFFSLISTMTTM